MRDEIRNLLIAGVPAVTDAGISRIFEPHEMRVTDGLPALIVRELVEPDTPQHAGPTKTMEVWPYHKRERFTDLDDLTEQVKATLDEIVFTEGDPGNERRFYCEHIRTGADQRDKEVDQGGFGGIYRTLEFEVSDLSWLQGTTFEPDPITTMRAWTEGRWPTGNPSGDVQTDPATWIPSDASPGIYWRLTALPRLLDRYPSWTLVEARISGHVLVTSKAKRLEWTRRIHHGLVEARRLTMNDGAPLDIEAIAADPNAHPIRDGQVTVTAQFGVLIPQEGAATLTHAHIGGDAGEQEVM